MPTNWIIMSILLIGFSVAGEETIKKSSFHWDPIIKPKIEVIYFDRIENVGGYWIPIKDSITYEKTRIL